MKLIWLIGVQLVCAICPCEKAKSHTAAHKHAHGAANALSFIDVEQSANGEADAIPADTVYEGLTPEVAIKTNDAMLRKAKASLNGLERTGKNDLSQVEAAKSIRKSAESRSVATEELLAQLRRAKNEIDDRLAQEAATVIQNSDIMVDHPDNSDMVKVPEKEPTDSDLSKAAVVAVGAVAATDKESSPPADSVGDDEPGLADTADDAVIVADTSGARR